MTPLPSSLTVSSRAIRGLDLAALDPWRQASPADLLSQSGRLSLQLEWPRNNDDPRELSEIPELRLWSLRADALCPWLPLLLERSQGDLVRHVAMLLPHRFHSQEGIRFAQDSLDLWVTHRLFLLEDWAAASGVSCRQGLAQMAAVLGFELETSFWDLLA
ncbi:MAG: CRR6 family NdhI maturation factor [Cyanobacteriota bacterium]